MINSKLVKLLSLLDQQEIKEFKQWVASPFFNKNKRVSQLANYLIRQYPHFSPENVDKQFINTKLLKAKNLKSLNTTAHKLSLLAEQYMVWKYNTKYPIQNELTYIDALESRGDKLFLLKEIVNTKKNLAKEKKHLFTQLELFRLNHILYRNNLNNLSYQQKGTQLINETLSCLNNSYINFRLSLEIEKKAKSLVFDVEEQVPLLNMDDILSKNAEKIKSQDNTSAIFIEIIECHRQPTIEKYKKLNHLVFTHIASYSPFLKISFIRSLINLSNLIYSSGETSILKDWFALYKYLVESNLFFKERKTNEGTFFNIVHLGCQLNEDVFIANFLQKCSVNNIDKEVLAQGNAMFWFHQKKYEQVLEILAPISFGVVYQNLNTRSLLAKTYFCTTAYDKCTDFLASFEMFIRRNKKYNENLKTAILNFILTLRKMCSVKFQDPTYKQTLKEYIQQEPVIAYKIWLLAQFD